MQYYDKRFPKKETARVLFIVTSTMGYIAFFKGCIVENTNYYVDFHFIFLLLVCTEVVVWRIEWNKC
jgi:hypothetical protein